MKYTNVMLTLLIVLTVAVTYRVYKPLAPAPSDAVSPQGHAIATLPVDTVDWEGKSGSLSITGADHLLMARSDSVHLMPGLAQIPCAKVDCLVANSIPGAAGSTLHVFRSGGGDTTIVLKGSARLVLRRQR